MLCWLPSSAASLRSRVHQHTGVEHVGAHGREGLVRPVRQAWRIGGLLQELLEPVAVRRRPHDAELRRLEPRHQQRRDRHPAPQARCASIICLGSIRYT